ncbi:MAG: hypothetical protein KAG61_02360 [Bacteriovoracaceae bacterium]|nr:hypothetical protein [Bacteriovoracaceae bacterium]
MTVNSIKVQFEKCYLDSIKIVLNHNIKEDIIFNHGSFFKQLATNLQGKLINNQIQPNSPPEVPRVIVQTKELAILFGLNRMEVEIKGSRKHVGKGSVYDLYKNKIKEVIGLFDSYLHRDEFVEDFIGIIGPLRFPQDMNMNKEELVSKLSSKFYARTNAKKIISFNTKLGFHDPTEDYFFNYEISDYEVKNVNVKGDAGKPVRVDLNTFPTVEHGMLYVVDVNNRPKNSKRNFKDDVSETVENFFDAIKNVEDI